MKRPFIKRAGTLIRTVGDLIRPSTWTAVITARASNATYTVRDEHAYVFVATSALLLWRARTLFSKEPETIEWIRSFGPDDVFYDIGANVGIYSIFAGVRCRKIYAFEPES